MDPRSRNALLITAVAILAIGLAAATLTSTIEPESEDGAGNATGDNGGQLPEPEPPEQETGESDEISTVADRILIALVALGMLAVLAYMVLYRRRTAAILLLLAGAVVFLWLLIEFLSEFGFVQDLLGGGGDGLVGSGGEGDDTGAEEAGESQPIWNLLLVAFVVGLLVIAAYLFRSREPQSGESDGDDPESDDEVTMMGEIAGQAADRIEGDRRGEQVVDNEVYRAYREMIRELDVENEDSTTPREFATVAAEHGMATEDVSELTDLFEEVRYGGYTATPDREKQAVSTLRRIERRYHDE